MSQRYTSPAFKFVAPEIVFGAATRHLAGRYAKNLGVRRALVVTDPGVVSAGWTAQVIASLEAEDVWHTVFSHVTPNPRAEEVLAGAEIFANERCNGIVAVGGGSPIDCAKAIGVAISNHENVLDFAGVDLVPLPGPPLICVPTTAGSSADVSQFAVITDTERRNKVQIVSKALVPDVSLIDSWTTSTMTPFITACTGLDALTHAMEAFVSSLHSPISDLHALEAVRLISRNLPRVLTAPDDAEARDKIMLGSLEAGLAFSNASLGAVHAMSHALGGLLDLAHGHCNAMVLVPVVAYNFDSEPQRYHLIGEAMGLELDGMPLAEQRAALIDETNRLVHALGFDQTLGEVGVQPTDIPALAARAMTDVCIVTNPRHPAQLEIEGLFEAAL